MNTLKKEIENVITFVCTVMFITAWIPLLIVFVCRELFGWK